MRFNPRDDRHFLSTSAVYQEVWKESFYAEKLRSKSFNNYTSVNFSNYSIFE